MGELRRTSNNKIVVITGILLLVFSILFSVSLHMKKEYKEYISDFDSYSVDQELNSFDNEMLVREIEYQLGYEENIKMEIENTRKKLNSSLFNKGSEQKKLTKELDMLSKLVDVKVEVSKNYISSSITNSKVPFMTTFIFSIVLLHVLFNQDQEADILPLFSSTQSSLKKIFFRKFGVLVTSLTVFSLIHILIMISTIFISKEALSNPIQSISLCSFFPYQMTIASYLVFKTFIILIIVMFSSFVIIIALNLIKNFIISLGILLSFFLVEYFLYSFISLNSPLLILKQINVFAQINGLYDRSLTNLFGIVINTQTMNIVLIVIISLVTLILSYITYTKSLSFKAKSNLIKTNIKSKSLFVHQMSQVLITFRGVIIVVLILSYSIYKYVDYKVIYPDWKNDFETVQSLYLGDVDEATLLELEEKIIIGKEARAYQVKCLEEECDVETLMIKDQESKDLWIYETIYDEISTTVMNGESYYLNKEGLDLLYNKDYQFSMTINFILIATASLLIVFLHHYGIKTRNVEGLLDSTILGYKKRYNTDLLVYSLLSILIFIIINGGYIMKLQKFYNMFRTVFDMNLILFNNVSISNISYLLVSFSIQLLVYLLLISAIHYLIRKLGLVKAVGVSLSVLIFIVVTSFLFYDYSILMLFTSSILNNITLAGIYTVLIIILNIVVWC